MGVADDESQAPCPVRVLFPQVDEARDLIQIVLATLLTVVESVARDLERSPVTDWVDFHGFHHQLSPGLRRLGAFKSGAMRGGRITPDFACRRSVTPALVLRRRHGRGVHRTARAGARARPPVSAVFIDFKTPLVTAPAGLQQGTGHCRPQWTGTGARWAACTAGIDDAAVQGSLVFLEAGRLVRVERGGDGRSEA